MIFAEIRDAAAAEAVLDDADAVDVEAADDRPARCAGREARTGDAGFREQQIAERGAAGAPQFLVGHYGDGCELVSDDGQHALLWCGRRCRLRRLHGCGAFAVAARRGPDDVNRRARRRGAVPLDRAWNRGQRRHRDVRELRRRVIGQCAAMHCAEQ
ncbi:hypothetical protein ACVWY2_008254 [Bradyrhizobium sp. JR6.1]